MKHSIPIQTTDISFPRSRKGSDKPLKTLWRSTMGVQSPSTDPTDKTSVDTEGVVRATVKIICNSVHDDFE